MAEGFAFAARALPALGLAAADFFAPGAAGLAAVGALGSAAWSAVDLGARFAAGFLAGAALAAAGEDAFFAWAGLAAEAGAFFTGRRNVPVRLSTTPASGGTLTTTDWSRPFHGSSSHLSLPSFTTPEPPNSAASELKSSEYTPHSGTPRRKP